MTVQALKEILEQIDYPVLIESVENIWYQTTTVISWNAQDNKEDLENEDGHTYTIEIIGGRKEYDGYLFVNGDNGCGETVTYMFNLEKEMKL